MSDERDLLFGRLAVQNRMVTQEHIQKCLRLQETSPGKPLGQILVEQDFLTIGQLDWLIKTQSGTLRLEEQKAERSPEEALFGKLAVSQNFITGEQLNECVREKENLGRLRIHFRLGEILIKKGYLTAAQVQQLLEVQKKRILVCEDCHCRFNIASFDAEQTFTCKFCGRPLVPPRDADSVVVKETLRMPRVVPGSRPATDMEDAGGD